MNKENIKNTLRGIAIGDAFGLGIEFQSRDWIRQNVDFTKFVNRREGKYAEGYEIGYYSDDTEHSIGLIRALIDQRPFSESLLLEYWKREYETDRQTKGFPRQGHGSIKDWYEGRKTIEDLKESSRNSLSPGCASPMRAVPLGLINSSFIDEYASINATTTHFHQKAIDSSIIIARASEHIIKNNDDPNQLFEYCMEHVSNPETLNYLTQIQSLPAIEELSEEQFKLLCGSQPIPTFKHRSVVGLPNSAMHVAGAALYIIRQSENAFSGLKRAISMGGDVDSIASICTGILGGRYGLDSIPQFMHEKTEGREKLTELANRFADYQQI